MKKKILLGLSLCLLLFLFASCGEAETVTVTYYDGDAVVSTVTMPKNSPLSLMNYSKTGYTSGGWYADAACTVKFENGTVVMNDLALYTKTTAMQYKIILTDGENVDIVDVTYDAAYDISGKSMSADGKEFLGWTYLGEDFAATGVYQYTASIQVLAKFRTIPTYTVTFKNADGSVRNTATVLENGTVLALTAPEKTGYSFAFWTANGKDSFDFSAPITENITLSPVYAANTYTLTVNVDGAQKQVLNVTYGESYAITTEEPTKAHAEFLNWKTADGKYFEGEGIWTLTADTVVDVAWKVNTDRVITVMDGEQKLDVITVTVDTASGIVLSKYNKTGYTCEGLYAAADFSGTAYDVTASVTDDLTLYAKIVPNTYTVTLKANIDDGTAYKTVSVTYGAAYDFSADVPAKVGYTFKGWRVDEETQFAAKGTYGTADNIVLYAEWEAIPDKLEKTDANYFLDTKNGVTTFVFLKGRTYTFTDSVLSFSEETAVDKTSDTTFTVTGTGTFEITVTKDGKSETFPALAVEDVSVFSPNADYTVAWITKDRSAFTVKDAKGNMKVGVKNYKPELNILDKNGNAVAFENAYIAVTVYDGETAVAGVTVIDGAITFPDTLVGKTVRVVMSPRYKLLASSIEISLDLNDGVNVYTNEDMLNAFGDLSVSTVNILRNFEAVIPDSQCVNDGQTLYNGKRIPLNVMPSASGVYLRTSNETGVGGLVLNGNYFHISGDNLEPIINRGFGGNGNENDGVNGNNLVSAYFITNVQRSVLNFACDAEFVVNDLYLTANYDTAKETELQNVTGINIPWLTQSASHVGIMVTKGTATFNNMTIRRTLIATTLCGSAPNNNQIRANYRNVLIDNSWANAIYAYSTAAVSLDNTYIGKSGGAAIHFDDYPSYGNADCKSSLQFGQNVVVNNPLVGNEAWLVAYGVNTIAGQIKAGLNTAIMQATSNTMTILRGDETFGQAFNFVCFVKDAGAPAESWATYSETPNADVTGTNYMTIYPTNLTMTEFGFTNPQYLVPGNYLAFTAPVPGFGNIQAYFSVYANN